MKPEYPKTANLTYLTNLASGELARYLRTKKQPYANIVIETNNGLYTTTLQKWIRFVTTKAAGSTPSKPQDLMKYLAAVFTSVDGWTPNDFNKHLHLLARHLTTMLADIDHGDTAQITAISLALMTIPETIRIELELPTDSELSPSPIS